MPPQKNSGNKSVKRESGVVLKNRKFIQTFLEDVREESDVSDIYIARVMKKMGNGRMEVFYVDNKQHPHVVQAIIRGSFRGKGKRSVWIDDNSVVFIADSGIGGSAEFEIMAVLSADEIRDLRKMKEVDQRILAMDITDTNQLMSDRPMIPENGFEFDISASKEDEEIDIDNL
jgi:hypothetical protein